MYRKTILATLLFIAALAKAEPPQITQGLSVIMQSASEYTQRLKTEKNPALYVAFPQPAAPSQNGEIFTTQEQLVSFFETLPVSIRSNGLWIKRMARNLWTTEDATRLASLTQVSQGKNFLLYLCEPKELSKNKSSWLAAWSCTRTNPPSNTPAIVCEAQPEKDKASGPSAWVCAELGQ